MNNLNQYIQEKLKITNKSKIQSEESPLFDLLNDLIKCDDAVIFEDDEIKEYYNIDKMTISYNISNRYITLDKLIIKDKRNGNGTKFMNDLCYWADKNNIKIDLTPSDSFGTSFKVLQKFYKNFGFVENKGRHTDFTTRNILIRKPK